MTKFQKRFLLIVTVTVTVICGGCILYIALAPRVPSSPPKDDNRPKITGNYISGLTLYDKNLYFGAGECFFELELNNHELNKLMCSETGSLFKNPVSAEDNLYAILPTKIFAISSQQRNPVWESDNFGIKYGNMAFFDERLYVTATGRNTVGSLGDYFLAIDPVSGELVWSYEEGYLISRNLPFLFHDNYLWLSSHKPDYFFQGSLKNKRGVALDPKTGQIVKTVEPTRNIDQILAIDETTLYGADINRTGTIFAVDIENPQKVLWEQSVGYRSIEQVFNVEGLLVFSNGIEVRAYNTTDGNLIWLLNGNNSIENSNNQPTEIENPLVFELKSTLYSANPQTGDVLWKYALSPYLRPYWLQPRPQPLVSEGIVYIANKDKIDSLDVRTGELLWEVEINDTQVEWYEDS